MVEEIKRYLTETEKQVAKLMYDGKVSREIADIMCISRRTVDQHRYNIKKKLGLNTLCQGNKSLLQICRYRGSNGKCTLEI